METVQKIQTQLDTIQKITTRIAELSHFSTIDRDIILRKIRDLYDTVLCADVTLQPSEEKKINDSLYPDKRDNSIVEEISEKEFEEEMIKETPIELNEQLPNSKPKKQYHDELLIRIETVEFNETPLDNQNQENNTTIPLEVVSQSVNPQSFLTNDQPDKILESQQREDKQIVDLSHNNQVSLQSNESLAAKLSHTKITSILGGMTVGDRMMYQKQLFKDRNVEFLKTLTSLEELDSFEEAEAWLQASYSWNFESPMVKNFLAIVKRRF